MGEEVYVTTPEQKRRYLTQYYQGNGHATLRMGMDAVRKKFGSSVAPNVASECKREAANTKIKPFKIKQGWKDSKVQTQETPRVIDISKIADADDEQKKMKIIGLAKEIRSIIQSSKTLKNVRVGEKEIDIQVLRLETERIGDDPVEQSDSALQAQS